MTAELAPLNFAIPVGTFNQANRDSTPHSGGQPTEPFNHSGCPFLIGLNRNPQTLPAPQFETLVDRLKHFQRDH